jgi:hypothetical protein
MAFGGAKLGLTTVKPEVSKQMKIAQDIMERYRSALGVLAK